LDLVVTAERLVIRLVDAGTSAPLSDRRVHLLLPEELYATTNDDGRATFALPTGTYSGKVYGKDHVNADFGPVEVGSTSTTTEVELRLGRGAVVHGALTMPDGNHVPDGVRLTAVEILEDGTIKSYTPGKVSQGFYSIEGLAAGTFLLMTSAQQQLGRVTLTSGEDRTLDLALPSEH
jgi:hypothetical protein